MRHPLVLLPVLLATLVGASPALAWTWPADGPVLQPFAFGADPYAAGLHRGIDVGGSAGSSVRAPAGGIVSFAGTVPGGGRTVTIQSAGGYAVTLLHLGSLGVARGTAVSEGAGVGTLGTSGDPEHDGAYVHLGVRVASDPQGYLDPLLFLPSRVPAQAVPDANASTAPAPPAAQEDAPAGPALEESATPEAAAPAPETGSASAGTTAPAEVEAPVESGAVVESPAPAEVEAGGSTPQPPLTVSGPADEQVGRPPLVLQASVVVPAKTAAHGAPDDDLATESVPASAVPGRLEAAPSGRTPVHATGEPAPDPRGPDRAGRPEPRSETTLAPARTSARAGRPSAASELPPGLLVAAALTLSGGALLLTRGRRRGTIARTPSDHEREPTAVESVPRPEPVRDDRPGQAHDDCALEPSDPFEERRGRPGVAPRADLPVLALRRLRRITARRPRPDRRHERLGPHRSALAPASTERERRVRKGRLDVV